MWSLGAEPHQPPSTVDIGSAGHAGLVLFNFQLGRHIITALPCITLWYHDATISFS